jgi:hypothetical protein
MQHFAALTHDEQAAAIRRLAAEGMSDHGIAHATGLAVEMVRAVLSPRACPAGLGGEVRQHRSGNGMVTPDSARAAPGRAASSRPKPSSLPYPGDYPSSPFSPERTRSERG